MNKCLLTALVLFNTHVQAAATLATDDTALGLYPAQDFALMQGQCKDCKTIPQALWYFEKEIIAVPRPDKPIAGFSPSKSAQQDIAQAELNALPSLVWLGSQSFFTIIKGWSSTQARKAMCGAVASRTSEYIAHYRYSDIGT